MDSENQVTNNSETVFSSGLTVSETFDYKWKIENFFLVQQIPHLLFAQRFSIETNANSDYHSKWTVGLFDAFPKNVDSPIIALTPSYYFKVGCRLEQMLSDASECYIEFLVDFGNNVVRKEYKQLREGEEIFLSEELLPYKTKDLNQYARVLKNTRNLCLKIKLKILSPVPKDFDTANVDAMKIPLL